MWAYDNSGNIENRRTFAYTTGEIDIFEYDEFVDYQYTDSNWGNLLSTTGTMATTLGAVNPLRYRGYVYDNETGLYYLQSRYYNPEIGRFINADGFISTGQGLLSNNMFAYCGNNPVNRADPTGICYYNANGNWYHDNWEYIGGYQRKPDPGTFEELSVLDDDPIDLYKGALVISTGLMDNCGFSYGAIFLADNISATSAGVQTVRHEYGHTLQLEEMGILSYTTFVVAPSIVCYWLDEAGSLDAHYYSLPWEYEADIYGGVKGRTGYSSSVKQSYYLYKFFVSYFSGNGMAEQYASRLNS